MVAALGGGEGGGGRREPSEVILRHSFFVSFGDRKKGWDYLFMYLFVSLWLMRGCILLLDQTTMGKREETNNVLDGIDLYQS